ncbi:MAG: hypothetical protein M3Z64_02245 [Verrucomicrobiota bacterium]|nr:hypothetical protein [Verrucomicrobiota bacterium]
MSALGERVGGPGRIYLTGGGTAVLHGWRTTTIDLDIKADPEPPNLFEALAELKESIDMNIELASPADFIPELPGWRDRSPFIVRRSELEFFHYDLYSQALSKIERSHDRDLADVRAMLDRALVTCEKIWAFFHDIEARLIRYPAIEPAVFRSSVRVICGAQRNITDETSET